MTDNGVPNLETLVANVRQLNRAIRDLEKVLSTSMEEHADAVGGYRAQYAHKLREHRTDGATVAEAEAYAKAACAVLERDRLAAEHKVAETLEKLEDRRGERASLNRLIDAVRP